MFFLTEGMDFPDVETASSDGILAWGGDLSRQRLLTAYRSGIFPWFDDDQMIIWWSPDPRMVLFPEKLKVSASMQKILDKNLFRITFNQNFKEVIQNCSEIKRDGQLGTWITPGMMEAYTDLFHAGYARSVEVWQNDELVGGLYGVDLGTVFCGESMFSKVSNASKAGFIVLVRQLQQEKYKLIDCQVYTSHLESLGAEEIPRKVFTKLLRS